MSTRNIRKIFTRMRHLTSVTNKKCDYFLCIFKRYKTLKVAIFCEKMLFNQLVSQEAG